MTPLSLLFGTKQFERGINEIPQVVDNFRRNPVGTAWEELAPLPVQALTYSPEAEPAFIGKKGFERLQRAGLAAKAKAFESRFHGNRYEVNPSKSANVWWAMGNPTVNMDRLLKGTDRATAKFKDLINPEEFPELATAYPKLFNMEVDLRKTPYEQRIAASYAPLSKDYNTRAKAILMEEKLRERYIRNHPKIENPNRSLGDKIKMDIKYDDIMSGNYGPRKHLGGMTQDEFKDYYQDHLIKKNSGRMNLTVPDQMTADNPSLDLVESLLHEGQHYIQKEELGRDFLNDYRIYDSDFTDDLFDAWTTAEQKKGRRIYGGALIGDILDQGYVYHMNPYEREAFEASKRDINPQYRESYSRKTEDFRKPTTLKFRRK